MDKREYWLDIAKSIGIFLVVLGHTSINENLKIFIYSFHMPLFFLISGFLFKTNDNFKNFFIKQFKRYYTLLYFQYYNLHFLGNDSWEVWKWTHF